MMNTELNLNTKIYARKCEIKEISDNNLVKMFLDINHLKGFAYSVINLGLYYEDELVSLMLFRKNNSKYELLRFCDKLNYSIIGGASKLFNFFIKKYNPEEIITYIDRSISQGQTYNKLGFNYYNKTNSNYYYIINRKRIDKSTFSKKILIKQGFDSSKTEHEIMLERKIYRIYDSGQIILKYKI